MHCAEAGKDAGSQKAKGQANVTGVVPELQFYYFWTH